MKKARNAAPSFTKEQIQECLLKAKAEGFVISIAPGLNKEMAYRFSHDEYSYFAEIPFSGTTDDLDEVNVEIEHAQHRNEDRRIKEGLIASAKSKLTSAEMDAVGIKHK